MLSVLASALAAAVLAVASPAPSPSPQQAMIDKLFTSSSVDAAWFAPAFLAQVPVAQGQQIINTVKAQLGAYKGSQPSGTQFVATFEKGTLPVDITLDAQGRIAGLFFHQPTLNGATPAPTGPPSSSAITPQAALARLFASDQLSPDWFTPAFLQAISLSSITQLIGEYKAQDGAFVRVDQSGQQYSIVFAHAAVPALIVLDDQGRIAGLRFLVAPTQKPVSLSDALAQLRGWPGTSSLYVTQNDRIRAAYNAELPLAVGSAFKLAVLNALYDQIQTGKHAWSDVVHLQPNWKSLPSGQLQDWPDGTALTLQTLATLMISISDNTAADSLANIVGRQAVEAFAPHSRPFLTTRELFILQSKSAAALRARYLRGDVAQRRAVVALLDKRPLPSFGDLGGASEAAITEDHFTTHELCGLIARVSGLPLMSVNPGVANASEWARVAFKGGSQAGVLNLTTWLKAKNGARYCVSATWNNTADLDESKFETLVGGVIEGLR